MAGKEETAEVGGERSSCSPSLEDRPGILIVGPSAVGKRTLLSRLLSLDLEDDPDSDSDSDSQLLIRGWTIDTKYYSADVSVWVAHLTDGFRIENLPSRRRLAAVVMIFDATDLSSLAAVQEWVSRNEIHDFEILLCVGNKVDLVPGHPVHQEYRRRLLRRQQKLELEQSASDEFGISETEGANLLGNNEDEEEVVEEDQSFQIRRSCIEWCTDRNIEYIEACASNPEFDKCLSVDGDSQGMERIFGALSAHMWPGMVLKSGNKIAEQPLPDEEELSEESDYELEYEVLSAGSAEPWDDTRWVSASTTTSTPSEGESSAAEKHDVAGLSNGNKESLVSNAGEGGIGTYPENGEKGYEGNVQLSSTRRGESSEDGKGAVRKKEVWEANGEVEPFDFEDLEKVMFEIGNIRDGLRLMPDVQRREMAANLAMKMASMFGGGSDDEEPDELE
ncbi:unnamed protein product [Linum tenue]|uniref:Uncharacterized protein n=1 Tax=Linum tenue TaxID=586396 RepID=A0AAV0PTY5_9ROSI|nr:unnamed protein product [Linum tenue]